LYRPNHQIHIFPNEQNLQTRLTPFFFQFVNDVNNVNAVNNVRCPPSTTSTLSTTSAVNHVNRVNDVNDVKTPTSAAFGGVSGRGRLRRRLVVRPPSAVVRLSRRLRRRFGGYAACGGGFF
jgi:hypothetical protein